MIKTSSYKDTLFVVFCFLVIGLLWYFQSLILVNIPYWDDFQGIILPVYDLMSDIPFSDKIVSLFSQNNEHRVVNDRLFMWLTYIIRGNYDMRFMAMLGFVNLIGIFWLLLKAFQKQNIPYYYLIPFLLFLFQPQYYESLQSLMVPFQNFSVIFYAFTAFYLVIYGGRYAHFAALVFASLSFYSHGNGIFTFIICALVLALRPSKKELVVWFIFSGLVIFSYFYGYKKPAWNTHSSPFENPVKSFFFFFEFLGSFSITYLETSTSLYNSFLRKVLPTISGLLGSALFVFFFFKKYPIKWNFAIIRQRLEHLRNARFELFIISCLLFFLFTAFVIALNRAGFPMLSRYTINSSLFIGLVYVFVISQTKGLSKRLALLIFSVIGATYLMLGYYNNWDIAVQKRKLAVTDGLNWQQNRMWVNQYYSSKHTRNINPFLVGPYNEKMYFFPESVLDKYRSIEPDTNRVEIRSEFNGQVLTITDDEQRAFNLNTDEGIYYIFKSKDHEFIVPGYYIKNGLLNFIRSGTYYSGVVKSGLNTHLIPDDSYEVIRLNYKDGKITKTVTGKMIETKNYGKDPADQIL